MHFKEGRIERAERRVREAEANVARQQLKLSAIQARGDEQGFRNGRQVMQAFKDALTSMKLRLREARRRPSASADQGSRAP